MKRIVLFLCVLVFSIFSNTNNLLAKEIENTKSLRDQDKNKLLSLIVKTKNTIPLLTNEKLLENETKIKIKELTNKITRLTKEFQKISYPKETAEEESKRIEEAIKEGEWGASGTA